MIPKHPGLLLLLPLFFLAGAMYGKTPEDATGLWSLRPIIRPDAAGIDELVRKRLKDAGLEPAPEADPRVLARRLSFDLAGLPPDPAMVEGFVNDPSPDAYEKLVDQLLASPHFGERWARHWLDVACFGESHGFEYNQPRENSWHYRNWVVQAFNSDLPYDRFARMQIAGDTMPETGADGVMATGFLVAGPHNTTMPQSDPMRKTMRQDEMEHMLAVVGQAFLGMTLNCARCHDHKTDPVTQKDYYRIVASLADVGHGERNVSLAAPEVRSDIEKLKVRARAARNRLRDLDRKYKEAVIAKRYQNDGQPEPPLAYESWDFRESLEGVAGLLQVKLAGGAKQDANGLHFDGKSAYAETGPVGEGFRAKTLEAWVRMDNLSQRGGGAMSLQTVGGGQFDAIVYGERDAGKWMAGSEFFRRYEPFQGMPEKEADKAVVHVAITYGEDGTVTGYREGVPYGKAYQKHGPAVYEAGKFHVVFGIRHFPPGGNRMLAGTVLRAKLYGRALGPAEVAASAGKKSDFVGEKEILAILDANQLEQRKQFQGEAEELQEKLSALEAANRPIPVYALNSGKPPVVHVLNRGNVLEPTTEAFPGGAEILPGWDFGLDSNSAGQQRRKLFSAWIIHPDNPLFARVIANRLWHHYFGTGIVDTPNDFGFTGGSPSHPELLDWLASELKRQQWSLKALHKTILLSSTYRQSSAFDPEAAKVDAGNRLLWRKSPRRMEGEEVRDAILAISGKLDLSIGGRGYRDVKEYKYRGSHFYDPVPQDKPEQFRRTLYRFSPRGARRTMLDTLDCPDPSAITPNRAATTTPLQSLALMNNDLVLDMAGAFAKRLEGQDDPVSLAYQLAYNRLPTREEKELGGGFIPKHGLPAYCRALFNSNEFLHVR